MFNEHPRLAANSSLINAVFRATHRFVENYSFPIVRETFGVSFIQKTVGTSHFFSIQLRDNLHFYAKFRYNLLTNANK